MKTVTAESMPWRFAIFCLFSTISPESSFLCFASLLANSLDESSNTTVNFDLYKDVQYSMTKRLLKDTEPMIEVSNEDSKINSLNILTPLMLDRLTIDRWSESESDETTIQNEKVHVSSFKKEQSLFYAMNRSALLTPRFFLLFFPSVISIETADCLIISTIYYFINDRRILLLLLFFFLGHKVCQKQTSDRTEGKSVRPTH